MTNLKNLVFLDIETVSGKPNFETLEPEMQALWEKKTIFLNRDEEVPLDKLYFDRAAIYSEFGKIICISVGILYHDKKKDLNIRIKSIRSHDEKQLLEEFVMLLHEKMDESKIQLCGHNAKEFDFPYICRRMIINGIPLPPYLQLSGKKPWEIKHLDTMEMWKFGDYKNYTSLALLTAVFEIPSPKNDIDGSDVNRVYYHEEGLDRIAEYCNRDVLATAQVYLKISGLELITEDHVSFVGQEND